MQRVLDPATVVLYVTNKLMFPSTVGEALACCWRVAPKIRLKHARLTRSDEGCRWAAANHQLQ